MALPVYDSGIGTGAAGGTSLTSGSFTIGSGANRALIVGVLADAATPPAITAVKWGGSGGVDLTRMTGLNNPFTWGQGDSANQMGFTMWYLVAPSSGSGTVYASFGGTTVDDCALLCASYTGVDQTTPASTLISSSGATINGSNSTASIVVNAQTDDLIIDMVGNVYQAGAAPVQGGSQTKRASVTAIGGYTSVGMSEQVGVPFLTTMQWTLSSDPRVLGWGMMAFALKPVSGGGGGGGTRLPPRLYTKTFSFGNSVVRK